MKKKQDFQDSLCSPVDHGQTIEHLGNTVKGRILSSFYQYSSAGPVLPYVSRV